MRRDTVDADGRGRDATRPTEIELVGWRDIAKRVAAEAKDDHLTLMSAGVAFYFLIALIPAIAAMVSIYALLADPSRVGAQIADFLSAAPSAVRDLVTEQAERVVQTSTSAASFGAVVSILLALWAASAGCQSLIEAVNAAYDETEKRSFVKRRGLALMMTVGAVLFLAVSVGAIAVVPALLRSAGLDSVAEILISTARWPLLAVFTMGALAIVYRFAPNREDPRWRWVSPGAVIATVLWLTASVGFSIYVSNFGSYNETYGSLGAVVIVMLWLFITALCIVLGAEVNAETERQTARDTTTGREAPMGHRRAYAADTLGSGAGSRAGHRRHREGAPRGAIRPRSAGTEPGGAAGHPESDGDRSGGWGAVAVTVAGRAVASLTRKRH